MFILVESHRTQGLTDQEVIESAVGELRDSPKCALVFERGRDYQIVRRILLVGMRNFKIFGCGARLFMETPCVDSRTGNWESHPNSTILELQGCTGVRIDDLILDGRRDIRFNEDDFKRLRSEPPGVNFRISGCANVVISRVTSVNAPLDGFYIGSTVDDTYDHANLARERAEAHRRAHNEMVRDLLLDNCMSENSARTNLAITTVEGLEIRGGRFAAANGLSPETGIQLEPNWENPPPWSMASRIRIQDTVFADNRGGGLILSWKGAPRDIVVQNCTFDSNNKSALQVWSDYTSVENCIFRNHLNRGSSDHAVIWFASGRGGRLTRCSVRSWKSDTQSAAMVLVTASYARGESPTDTVLEGNQFCSSPNTTLRVGASRTVIRDNSFEVAESFDGPGSSRPVLDIARREINGEIVDPACHILLTGNRFCGPKPGSSIARALVAANRVGIDLVANNTSFNLTRLSLPVPGYTLPVGLHSTDAWVGLSSSNLWPGGHPGFSPRCLTADLYVEPGCGERKAWPPKGGCVRGSDQILLRVTLRGFRVSGHQGGLDTNGLEFRVGGDWAQSRAVRFDLSRTKASKPWPEYALNLDLGELPPGLVRLYATEIDSGTDDDVGETFRRIEGPGRITVAFKVRGQSADLDVEIDLDVSD